MTATYGEIITALDTLISGITGVKSHYTYAPQQITAYPAVTITPNGHTDKFLSLKDTQREISFTIRLWGKMEDTRTDTQVTIRDLADEIINTVGSQANITLGGVVEWSQLTDGKFAFSKENAHYIFECNYKCVTRYSR